MESRIIKRDMIAMATIFPLAVRTALYNASQVENTQTLHRARIKAVDAAVKLARITCPQLFRPEDVPSIDDPP